MNTIKGFIARKSQRGGAHSQDNALGLMHLRKLYVELCCTATPLSQKEQEDKLYMMLPLFCKVFEHSPASEMIDKFGDVLQFANHVARLFVTEIRRRASNQTTEDASRAIAEYLEVHESEEASNGWMLLTTLNLLSSGGASIVNTMTMASLPSTLVKCLYLFFDLPEIKEEKKQEDGEDKEGADAVEGTKITQTKRRKLLHTTVIQILVRLCNHPAPAEELASKDDLTLLFSAITSWCPAHNVPWRKGAAEVLTTISRHGLTDEVVQYIHTKNCLALCIDNMRRVQELTPLEIVEMCFTVFCFLKDSSDKSQVLLDDFRTCEGYIFLADFVLKLEAMGTEESIHSSRNLVLLISSLTSCGFIELRPNSAVFEAPFQLPDFTFPTPSGKGNSVKNLQAFQVLQTVFLKANSDQLCKTILEVITSIYNSDNANYFILEPQHTLSQFIDQMTRKSSVIQTRILELLEFVVFNLNFVPYKELISVSLLLKAGSRYYERNHMFTSLGETRVLESPYNSDSVEHQAHCIECNILAVHCLLRIVRYSQTYSEVFREVGLLEVMVTCLHQYAAMLKNTQSQDRHDIGAVAEIYVPERQQRQAFAVMECLTLLLKDSDENATIFRECGGARCAHNLVPYIQCRHQALATVQQLILGNNGSDDMVTLIIIMQSAPIHELQLKIDIIKALHQVLLESHKSRAVFREAGGYISILSVLLAMEDCLSHPLKEQWNQVSKEQVKTLLEMVVQVLAVSMRQEPANAKFFSSEIGYDNITRSLRFLGCFTDDTCMSAANYIEVAPNHDCIDSISIDTTPFHNVFDIEKGYEDLSPDHQSSSFVLKLLYNLAVDTYREKPTICHSNASSSLPSPTPSSSTNPSSLSSEVASPRPSVASPRGSLVLNSPMRQHAWLLRDTQMVVHPGAILCMVDLISSISVKNKQEKMAVALQMHILEVIYNLLNLERNQQVLCEVGLPQRLLEIASYPLANEDHILHCTLQHMVEKLATQAFEPKELRDFLRLGSPLDCKSITKKEIFPSISNCISDPENSDEPCHLVVPAVNGPTNENKTDQMKTPNEGQPLNIKKSMSAPSVNSLGAENKTVSLTRVKCLVSMTTPRDTRLSDGISLPAFVEFDMSIEGYGCLFLPSIAPQNTGSQTAVAVGMATGSVLETHGGIGSGERTFPPQSGVSFSAWFCVDQFGSMSESRDHPVRLLSIIRTNSISGPENSCFTVSLSSKERKLTVCTAEVPFGKTDKTNDKTSNNNVDNATFKFFCQGLAQEGRWHHLGVVFNKAVIKNSSSASVFVDGALLYTHKIPYIQNNTNSTGSSPSNNHPVMTHAYIGTPPSLYTPSQLLWRLGPTHLIEDALSSSSISAIFQLGPAYVGSFLAPRQDDSGSPEQIDMNNVQIPEEKIVFGLHTNAQSVLTISRLKKAFNKMDSKAVAKQLNLSSHDNATPIRFLHNSAAHLSGPARSFGAVLIGGNGVRTFCPKPVSSALCNIGGCGLLLGLVAMAKDVEGLYAAVKALVCVVKNNRPMVEELERRHGFQVLAYLFKRKQHLLNSHILHLTFSLVGTIDSDRETTLIPRSVAFEDLLCDLEVWHNTPYGLQRSLYEHFLELITDSVESEKNRKLMLQLGMVKRLLNMLRVTTLSHGTVQAIMNLLSMLLQAGQQGDILSFGQFLASTLPILTSTEMRFSKEEINSSTPELDFLGKNARDSENLLEESPGCGTAYSIYLRNNLLEILLKLLYNASTQIFSASFCEDTQKALGFDWFLLFLEGHLHPTTVILVMRILITILLNNYSSIIKFKDGTVGGGWLEKTEPVLHNRVGVVLGLSFGKSKKQPQSREIITEACHLEGFTMLQWLLRQHIKIPEIYFLLMALSLGQRIDDLPENCELALNPMWQFIFKAPPNDPGATSLDIKVNILPEAIIVILALVREILNQQYEDPMPRWAEEYPVTLIQFLLYLYSNVRRFKPICMSANFLHALAATLFPFVPYNDQDSDESSELSSPTEDLKFIPGSDIPIFGAKVIEKNIPINLTTHPGKRFVLDLIRVIVVDSLSLPMPSKGFCVLDILLETCPDRASMSQINEFQTELLSLLMARLLAGDVLLGKNSALPITSGGSYNNQIQNVFYFCSRVVDKLWQGSFTNKSKEVFEFIASLLGQSKKKSHGLSLESVYHCLNRTVLYQLSRPCGEVSDQMSLLETLRHITEKRVLLFGAGNYEQEFLACLCHCLFCLTDDLRKTSNLSLCLYCQTLEVNRSTTWHVDHAFEKCEHLRSNNAQQGELMVRKAARRVWDDLITSKKQQIEEIFKVSLPNSSAGQKNYSMAPAVDLKIAKPALGESATRSWQAYIADEKKTRDQAKQTQSRIVSKVTSGLQPLLSSRKTKRESAIIKGMGNSMVEISMWTFTHIFIVRELVELQFNQFLQSQRYLHRFISEKWEVIEYELLRERGLFGPEEGHYLDKWMLDMTEGHSRMRKKMIKNDMFFTLYPYRASIHSTPSRSSRRKMVISHDSKSYTLWPRTGSLLDLPPLEVISPELEDDQVSETSITEADVLNGLTPSRLVTRQSSDKYDDEELETPDSETQVDKQMNEPKTDHQMVLKLLEEGEKIRHIFRCARIQGLDTSDGLLLFCKDHFYVVDGFTLLSSREIRDIDSVPAQHQDPIIPRTSRMHCSHLKRTSSKFAYEDIREVMKRRYLLHPIAIEVFSADGRNYLLAFPRKVRNKVYQRFLAEAPRLTDDANQSVAGQKRNAQVEGASNFLGNLISEKSVTQRWERGEVSNFQYLMALNTLAGRSYNDLMQYPVFPWILADYSSEELDLRDERTFRDLSKPMGAQTVNRLEQFKKKYEEWENSAGETTPYHYGTHYSCAMIVASFLIRMEPFTQHFLRLQGGQFDLADRMFHCIGDSWMSASEVNMADIKELIPEFFYLPEILTNHNNFDLGVKQSGTVLGDVILPPWAKGDAREFIRVHREALECDYVSSHLHEWIDLIFGYKQHGKDAQTACNVFHPLFYEGNVDIYTIADPLEKNAIIDFINNFGQIPTQLFKKPHPQKKVFRRVGDSTGTVVPISRLFFHNLDTLKPSHQSLKELKGAVGQIIPLEKSILAVEQNKVLFPPTYNRFLAFGYADYSLRIGSYESDKAVTIFEGSVYGEILCAACPNSRTIITGGTSTVVHVWRLEYKKERTKQLSLKQAMYGHTKPVTCLAVSVSYNLIVSGSKDQTCIVWDLNRLVFIRQLRGLKAPVTAVAINTLTGDIATCAGAYLHLWSINGEKLCSVNSSTGKEQRILCCAMSELVEWDLSNVIITGSSDGVVRMWSMEYVQVPDETQAVKKSPHGSNNASAQPSPLLSRVNPSEFKRSSQNDDTPSEEDTMSLGSAEMSLLHRENSERSLSESYSEEIRKSKDSFDDLLDDGPRDRTLTGDSLEELQFQVGNNLKISPPTSLSISPNSNTAINISSSEECNIDPISASLPEGRNSDESGLNLPIFSKSYAGTTSLDPGTATRRASQPELTKEGSPFNDNKEEHLESPASAPEFSPDGGTISSKSSIRSDEYVIISDQELKAYEEEQRKEEVERRSASHRNKLKPGFKWQRQLVFRSKLTMHTAFERKDNKNPAAVTTLAISKDHLRVYVGDEQGRVFAWWVGFPGKSIADHWMRDDSDISCTSCKTKFTITERRHHCRNCGKLFCAKCSRYEAEIPRLRIYKAVRVCQTCHSGLKFTCISNDYFTRH